MISSSPIIRPIPTAYTSIGNQSSVEQKTVSHTKQAETHQNRYESIETAVLSSEQVNIRNIGFESIDAHALNSMLGQMGAIETSMPSEPGQLIDIYT